MHSYFLIPLLTSIGACMIGAAVVARDPNSRANRVSAGLLGATVVWALCDFGAHLYVEVEPALRMARIGSAIAQLVAPLSLNLLIESRSELRDRLGPLLLPAWIATGLCMAYTAFTPGVIADLRWDDWGWSYTFGSFALVPISIGFGIFLLALSLLYRSAVSLVDLPESIGGRPVLGLVLALLAMLSVTDVVMPALDIAAPRFASPCVVLLGLVLWGLSFRTKDYVPAPGTYSREVLEALDDGVALISADGRIRAVNQALANLTGVWRNDLVDRDVREVVDAPLEQLQIGVVDKDLLLRRPEGDAVPILYSTSRLLDHEGLPMGFVLVFQDQREMLELRRRLVTASRLAAVGELAAGLAHEVNNPVAYIQSNLHTLHRNDQEIDDRLEKELPSHALAGRVSEGHHLIGQSLQEIARVSSIVKEVRGFSHMGPDEVQWNDVNTLIESAVRIALPQLRRSAKLVREYGELPLCHGAGQDLKQLFLGLLLRAARSFEGSGTVRIETTPDEASVSIVIEDDGEAIASDQLERIFEPAFGEEPRDDGDPDLSVSYQIVRQHGGEIEVESALGVGTRVKVVLPISGVGAGMSGASTGQPGPPPADGAAAGSASR